jgi:hypothetical protein
MSYRCHQLVVIVGRPEKMMIVKKDKDNQQQQKG